MSENALAARALALVEGATSRGKTKQLAAALVGDTPLRQAIVALGRSRGADLPDEAVDWPAVKLLRWARARQAPSRQRLNPIRRDEAFDCLHCGRHVPKLEVTSRDHCPFCLRSLHVDVVPGDRENTCGGLLDPVGGSLMRGQVTIRYRCRRCGASHQVRAALEGESPDDWEMVVRTLASEPPP